MRRIKPIKPFLIVAILLALFYGIGIGWGLKSEFSPSVDVPFPRGPLIFVGQYSDPTEAAKYPALHYLLNLPLYAVVIAFFKITGGLSDISSRWPYGFSDPVLAFSSLLVVSRILSILMGIGLLLVLWKLRPESTDRRSHLLAIALLALSGPFTFYTREANFDVPYNFWWGLAVLFAWRYLFVTQKARPDLIWAGVFAALSLATKDQVAGALVGLGLGLLLIQPAGERLSWGRRFKNTFLFGLCAAVTYFLFAIAPHPARWWYHLSLWTLDSPSVSLYIAYPATLGGYIGLSGAVLRNLGIVLSPVGIFLVIVGFYALVRSKQASRGLFFLLPALTYIFIIIMSIRFVYERFMLPVAVVMVPVAGLGASYLAKHTNQHVRRAGFALVLFGIVLQVFVGYLPVTYMQLYDTKRRLAETLDQYVAPGSPLLVELNDSPSFPNAAVYTNYKLMLPEGKKPEFRAEEHIFADYAPGAHCLLSANRLDESSRGIKRVASWENPVYVSRFVMNPLLRDFYLYDIDGKCQAREGN